MMKQTLLATMLTSVATFSQAAPRDDVNWVDVERFGHGRYTVWMVARASPEFPVVSKILETRYER